VLDNYTPEDNERDDNGFHKQVRTQTQQPTTRADDREFTIEEIRDAIESIDNKKAPRGSWHHRRHLQPRFSNFTKIHNRNVQWILKRRCIPKEVEESKDSPNNKTWLKTATTYGNTAQSAFSMSEAKY
jgi:hypothetical protein